MRALQFGISIPRFLLGRSVGKVTDWAVFGAPSGLRPGEHGVAHVQDVGTAEACLVERLLRQAWAADA